MGNEETIKKHLLKYYSHNRKKVVEIKEDWKGFLKVETNYGDTYTKIMSMIIDDSKHFYLQQINRHTLFPLEEN